MEVLRVEIIRERGRRRRERKEKFRKFKGSWKVKKARKEGRNQSIAGGYFMNKINM